MPGPVSDSYEGPTDDPNDEREDDLSAECPTPCHCGTIVDLHDMIRIPGREGHGNVECKWCAEERAAENDDAD